MAAINDETGQPVVDDEMVTGLYDELGRPTPAILDESGQPILDEASGFIYDESGQSLSQGGTCGIDVYAGLALTAIIRVNVGAPYQGNLASLATDRWVSTTPS